MQLERWLVAAELKIVRQWLIRGRFPQESPVQRNLALLHLCRLDQSHRHRLRRGPFPPIRADRSELSAGRSFTTVIVAEVSSVEIVPPAAPAAAAPAQLAGPTRAMAANKPAAGMMPHMRKAS